MPREGRNSALRRKVRRQRGNKTLGEEDISANRPATWHLTIGPTSAVADLRFAEWAFFFADTTSRQYLRANHFRFAAIFALLFAEYGGGRHSAKKARAIFFVWRENYALFAEFVGGKHSAKVRAGNKISRRAISSPGGRRHRATLSATTVRGKKNSPAPNLRRDYVWAEFPVSATTVRGN